jgi:hypothetical protein
VGAERKRISIMRQRAALRPYLAELEQVKGPLGLPIERDLSFTPKTLRELKRLHEQGLRG